MNLTSRNDYTIEPWNRFFAANRSIVEYEIRPGNTVTFLSQVDLTDVEIIRAAKDVSARKPSYTAFVAKAVALTLREFPYANRRLCRRAWLPFSGTKLQQFNCCDVAVACERNIPGAEVATFADILRDADQLSLGEITEWLHALATCDVHNNKQWQAFSGAITRLPHWLSTLLIRLPYFFPSVWVKFRGGPVLISSPAKYGVDVMVATWSWPLGVSFGFVKEQPAVRDGIIVACPMMTLTLTFDRRVMAGAQAARFFKRFVDILEHAKTEMAAYLPPASPTTTENGTATRDVAHQPAQYEPARSHD
jgi:pyruvate/2-oxoglutarate dehydrogenase complex dihydrolipoamide acyltransferase (E2) component